jgi:hypothetical protein
MTTVFERARQERNEAYAFLQKQLADAGGKIMDFVAEIQSGAAQVACTRLLHGDESVDGEGVGRTWLLLDGFAKKLARAEKGVCLAMRLLEANAPTQSDEEDDEDAEDDGNG